MTRGNFVVPVFHGGDLCDIDGKTHSFHVRIVTHAKFMVPFIQGGDLCYVGGKTSSFYIRIGGSKRKFDLLWFEPHFFEKNKKNGVNQSKFVFVVFPAKFFSAFLEKN